MTNSLEITTDTLMTVLLGKNNWQTVCHLKYVTTMCHNLQVIIIINIIIITSSSSSLTTGMFCKTWVLTGDTKSMVALFPRGDTLQQTWNTRTSTAPLSWFLGPLHTSLATGSWFLAPLPLRRTIRHLKRPESSARKLSVSGTWLASTTTTFYHSIINAAPCHTCYIYSKRTFQPS